jgi:hypothetical protein
MIIGTYVYMPKYNVHYAETPTKVDTLILKSNNTFKSNYYGSGTYKIEHGFFDITSIDLIYNDGFGLAGYGSYFTRSFLIGKPRITVVEDLDLYYEKID